MPNRLATTRVGMMNILRWLAPVWLWLTTDLILWGDNHAMIIPVEGVSVSNRGHNRANSNPKRHYEHGRRGQPGRPRSRFGSSTSNPNIDMIFDADEEGSSSSYFERNGLVPPPLISRRRRRAQTVPVEQTPNDEPASELDSPTELESIIESAKYGEDANTRLRHDLLNGHDGNFDRWHYDKHSYPWEYIWYNQTVGRRSGVPIEMNINFHRVFSVDIVDSVMDLVVWVRFVWVDPRLTWKPEEYGNLNYTWFWIGDGGAGGETSEIWTPDIKLWNLETGMMDSLEDTYARVSHDGTVWWGRPGHIRPVCKFSGLKSFPFDKLTCAMEFASWTRGGKYLDIKMYDGMGYTMGGSLTAGESFEEYSFADEDPISVERYNYAPEYSEDYSEDSWPVLLYNVTVQRSWQPFARGYIATQALLNFVGFSAFWLPPSCGERMGLSITAMLAALAAEIVIASYLPACAELTWFSKFSILSMIFAFVSLVESVTVLYFYYKRSEDLVPHWYTYTKNWYLVRQATKGSKEVNEMVGRTTGFFTETTNTAVTKARDTILRPCSPYDINDPKDSSSDEDGIWEDDRKPKRDDKNDRLSGPRFVPHINIEEDEKEKTGNNKHVSFNETDMPMRSPSAATSTGIGPRRATTSEEGPSIGITSDSGQLRRRSVLLKDFTDRHGHSMMTMGLTGGGPRDADDFNTEEEIQNNLKWKHVAARIDDVARFWIPTTFIISLAIVFSVKE